MMRTWSIALSAAMLVACGAQPQKGFHEDDRLTPSSSALPAAAAGQPIEIGTRHFLAARQMMGGDLTVDPALLRYVQQVGRRIAAVSGYEMPFEFGVVNNSVPNVWSLPGGRIVVTRGLLMQLQCEVQLAALLAHEITHSVATGAVLFERDADTTEQEILLPESALALRAGAGENAYAPFVVGYAALVANLITRKHDLQEELTADRRALLYLRHAGYDPSEAVDMQRAFVRLGRERTVTEEGWQAGLFMRHPPSRERVESMRALLTQFDVNEPEHPDQQLGCQPYERAMEKLRQLEPAYAAYEEGVRALRQGDRVKADVRARAALMLARGDISATTSNAAIVDLSSIAGPEASKDAGITAGSPGLRRDTLLSEPGFHGLMGDVAFASGRLSTALVYYHDAVQLDPGYFKYYLSMGLIAERLGEHREAARLLDISMSLLPTSTGAYYLGRIAREAGDLDLAVRYFQLAATSDTDIGRSAAKELITIDLPWRPAAEVARQ